MATKSDFAQKLLNDLRQRKEHMTVTENSCNINSGSRDSYGRSAQTYRGSGQIKALDSIGKKGGKSHQSSGRGNRSFNHEASSSNQLVPYGKGRISEGRSDLSVAFRLAFGNGSRVDIKGNTALIKLLNQIETRPLDIKAKKEMDTKRQNQLSSTPVSSTFHITEISKGVEKLKQVIKAYPNGLDLNGRSTQAGRELLKGAMDLEQSLRMLVNLQEASDQKASAQRKIKIRLLDEDEDDGDGRKATVQADQKNQVDRPRFSFDKPSNKNARGNKESSTNNYIKKHLMALSLPEETPKSDIKKETLINTSANMKSYHKRSVSVPDFRTPALSETQNHPNSSLPGQEKGRISNVIAKLMGLEAFPQKENNNHAPSESRTKTKERLVSKTAIISAETNVRDAESRRPTMIDNKRILEQNIVQPLSKGFQPALKSSFYSPLPLPKRLVHSKQNKSDSLLAPDSYNTLEGIGRDSMANPTGRPRQSLGPSVQFPSGYCAASQGKGREAKGKQDKEQVKDSKKLISPTEPRNQVQVQPKYTTQIADNYEFQGAKTRGKAPETVTRSTCRIHPGKQQNPHNQRELKHLKRPKEIERQEDKYQIQKRKQYLGRQKLLEGGRKISSVESDISRQSKILYSSSQNTQQNIGKEAQNKSKFLQNGGSLMTGKYLSDVRDNEKNVQQATSSKVPVTGMPTKDLTQHRDHKKNVQQETPSELILIQRRTGDGSTCSGGIQDNFVSVLNGNEKEKVASLNDLSVVLYENVQESRKEIHKEVTEHEYNQHKEAEVANDDGKKSSDQPLNVEVTTHIEAMEFTKLCSPEEEGQLQQTSRKIPSNEKQSQDLSIEGVVAFKDNYDDGPPNVSRDIEKKQVKPFTDQQTETWIEETNFSNIVDAQQRIPLPLGIEEKLTESEELLKRKLTKSRYFLNTAEALLKLDIPVQNLNGDDDKVQDTETKLTLECSHELLKWKGKKHEFREHPYSCMPNNYINRTNSFKELIQQLSKDMDTLKSYGGTLDCESDVADVLHTMLEKDIQHGISDVSFMWDHGWGELTFAFIEKDDIVKDVEKHMLNGLLNEITLDLLHFATTT